MFTTSRAMYAGLAAASLCLGGCASTMERIPYSETEAVGGLRSRLGGDQVLRRRARLRLRSLPRPGLRRGAGPPRACHVPGAVERRLGRCLRSGVPQGPFGLPPAAQLHHRVRCEHRGLDGALRLPRSAIRRHAAGSLHERLRLFPGERRQRAQRPHRQCPGGQRQARALHRALHRQRRPRCRRGRASARPATSGRHHQPRSAAVGHLGHGGHRERRHPAGPGPVPPGAGRLGLRPGAVSTPVDRGGKRRPFVPGDARRRGRRTADLRGARRGDLRGQPRRDRRARSRISTSS